MKDFSRCINNECPSRDHCLRFTKLPHDMLPPMQSIIKPIVPEGKDACDDYIPGRLAWTPDLGYHVPKN